MGRSARCATTRYGCVGRACRCGTVRYVCAGCARRCGTVRYVCAGGARRAPGVRPAGGACRGCAAYASAIGRISTISRKTTAAVVASPAAAVEAMVAPAVAVTPTGPRAHAQEDTVVEIARPIKADRRTLIRCVVIVAVGTHRLNAYANADLRISSWHHCQSCE